MSWTTQLSTIAKLGVETCRDGPAAMKEQASEIAFSVLEYFCEMMW